MNPKTYKKCQTEIEELKNELKYLESEFNDVKKEYNDRKTFLENQLKRVRK